MDLPLAAMDPFRRRRRWLILLAAAGLTGYGAYKFYHLPAVARKRREAAKLLEAIFSLAEAVSSSTDTVSLLSADLNAFLRSESDEIPASIKQLSKLARSEEFAASVSRVSESLTIGVLRGMQRGYSSQEKMESSAELGARTTTSGFSDRVHEMLFSAAGTGFVSVVAGNFARGLVMGFYSGGSSLVSAGEFESAGFDSNFTALPQWVLVLCSDKVKRLIGDCIQVFVSTAVAVYLNKTMDINTYDEIFSGLTNPKHESKMKDMLVSVCNGAVDTFVKTTHQVMTSSKSSSSSSTGRCEDMELPLKQANKASGDDSSEDGSGWIETVSATLAIPSNRRFVLDVTGRVTFETMRSFLDFSGWKLYECGRRGMSTIQEEVVDRGLEVVKYASARSIVILTICLSLCLHLFSRTGALMLA